MEGLDELRGDTAFALCDTLPCSPLFARVKRDCRFVPQEGTEIAVEIVARKRKNRQRDHATIPRDKKAKGRVAKTNN